MHSPNALLQAATEQIPKGCGVLRGPIYGFLFAKELEDVEVETEVIAGLALPAAEGQKQEKIQELGDRGVDRASLKEARIGRSGPLTLF